MEIVSVELPCIKWAEENICESHFVKTTRRYSDDRYIIKNHQKGSELSKRI